MRRFGRHQASWRKLQLERLNKKLTRLLDTAKLPTGCKLHPRLPVVEAHIGNIQKELTDIQALKVRRHWRENGEISAGYLKRSIRQQRTQCFIATLKHPDDPSVLCNTPPQLADAATSFYKNLLAAEDIDPESVQTLSDTIHTSDKINKEETDDLLTPISIDCITRALHGCPRKCAPGMDGLPYGILKLVAQHTFFAPLMLKIFNDALFENNIPESWKDACMSLLPKFGDLTSLGNWRPISLINTDAKTFTRIVNKRLMSVFSSKISLIQMGFMSDRFIGENGRLLQLMLHHANRQQDSDIGVCIDQSKAYDRVHPLYLK